LSPTSNVLRVLLTSDSFHVSKSSGDFALLLLTNSTSGTLPPPSTHPSGQALTDFIFLDEYPRVVRMVFKRYEFRQCTFPLDYMQDSRHWDRASSKCLPRICRSTDCPRASRLSDTRICRNRWHAPLWNSGCTSPPLLGIRHPCGMVCIRSLPDKQCLILTHSESC